MPRPQRIAGDLQGGGGKWHAQGKFGEPDLAGGHDLGVASQGEQAAGGDRVAVDRSDRGGRVVEGGEQRIAKSREECGSVAVLVLEDAAQVEPGAKRSPGPGDDEWARSVGDSVGSARSKSTSRALTGPCCSRTTVTSPRRSILSMTGRRGR